MGSDNYETRMVGRGETEDAATMHEQRLRIAELEAEVMELRSELGEGTGGEPVFCEAPEPMGYSVSVELPNGTRVRVTAERGEDGAVVAERLKHALHVASAAAGR